MVIIPVIFRIVSRPSFSAHPCPTLLCPEVQEAKPPPWPQERFTGEAPYREPLLPDTLARMELPGKNTLEGLGPDGSMTQGKKKEASCKGGRLGGPNLPGIRCLSVSAEDPLGFKFGSWITT
jgi:hypothetical protein